MFKDNVFHLIEQLMDRLLIYLVFKICYLIFIGATFLWSWISSANYGSIFLHSPRSKNVYSRVMFGLGIKDQITFSFKTK